MHTDHSNANRLAIDAVQDRGLPLPAATRSLMEHCFQTNLSAIRLHCSSASNRANRALGSMAFAIGPHIGLRHEFTDPGAPAFTRILAHEITHTLQKARAVRTSLPVPAWLLEAEADRSMMQILRHEPVTHLTADPSPAPRCWDIEGHYYTILWMSLAAGLPFKDAKRNAFYAQMPDQVEELDAIPAAITYGEEVASLEMDADPSFWGSKSILSHFPSAPDFAKRPIDPLKLVHAWEIQAGLHSLTGQDAVDETEKRLKRLYDLEAGTFEFALAIHPFGDSYAHRNGSKMYPSPVGHGMRGHGADAINQRVDFYRTYGMQLYNLFAKKWGVPESKRWEGPRVDALLFAVTGWSKQSNRQIPELLESARCCLRDNNGVSNDKATELMSTIYRPDAAENKEVPWASFLARNHDKDSDIPLENSHFERSNACAKQWAQGAVFIAPPSITEAFGKYGVLHEFVFGLQEF